MKVPGVTQAEVDLAHKQAVVIGTADSSSLVKAVDEAGYMEAIYIASNLVLFKLGILIIGKGEEERSRAVAPQRETALE